MALRTAVEFEDFPATFSGPTFRPGDQGLPAGSVRAALALYRAMRKPETDELQRFSRQGGDEGALTDPFAAQQQSTPVET